MKDKIKKLLNPFSKLSFKDSLANDIASIQLFDQNSNKSIIRLFLNRYSPEDIYQLMKKVGMLQHLAKRKLDDVVITIDYDYEKIHYLKIYNKEKNPDNLMIDLRLRETKFFPNPGCTDESSGCFAFDMIVIEWLSAENPFSKFSLEKPQLPGQSKPGLGALRYCFKMMYQVAKGITRDGFMDVPDHAHGAVMYSKRFKFFDPTHEGVLRAILRDLNKYSLSDISWGIITRTIIDLEKGRPHEYNPSEQMFYVSSRLKSHFKSPYYKNLFKEYYSKKQFSFNYKEMVKKRTLILAKKNIIDL